MKKIFSILMALAVVLGANAQALKVAGKQMQKGLNIQKTATVDASQLKAMKDQARQRGVMLQEAAPKHVAAAAQGATAPVSFLAAYYGSYGDIQGDWSLNIRDAAGNWYGELDFISASETAIGGTYTCDTTGYANGTVGSGYGVFVVGADTLDFYAGTFSIAYTKSVSGNPCFQVTANLQADSTTLSFSEELTCQVAYDYLSYVLYQWGFGDIEFIYLDDVPVVPTGDTIYCDLGRAEIEYFEESGDYYIEAENEGYDYAGTLYIYTTTLAGTYGPDDFEMKYTKLYDMVAQDEIALKAAISATIVETPDTTFINALLMGRDGNVYAISMKEYAIAITDTVAIHFVTPKWNEHVAEAGWWQVIGSESADSAYVVSLSNNENDQVAGTYTLPDMDPEFTYIYIGAEETFYSFINLTVTITVAADGAVTIVAQGDAKNGVHYNMTFDVIPGTTGWKELYEAGNLKKYIQNGQVFIEKNGVKYNAAGVKF